MSLTKVSYSMITGASRNVLDYGADPTGAADSTVAIQAALDSLPNGGTVFVPRGTYSVKSVTINYSYISLVGEDDNSAKFVSPAGQWGQTIKCNDKSFVAVRHLTIDNDLAQVEGALWFGGARNCIIENCRFLNGDLTSMAISGVGGVQGGTRIAYDNLVKDCYAEGQKAYFPNGTSPFIAGNNSQRTTFLNCVVADCVADAYDADNAPYTRFINCTATESGSRAPYAAFWSECTETNVDGYEVTWENCYAYNYGVGFGTSELVQGTMINPIANNCTKAIWHHANTNPLTVIGGTFDYCGENSPTSAAVLLEFTATMNDVVFKNTQYTNAILVYSGDVLIDDSVQISKCTVDKNISAGYEGNGPLNVRITGCLFNSCNISWYNCSNKTVIIDGNIFVSGGIAGARIGNALVTGNTFRDNNALPTLTAIDLSIDAYNTYFTDNTFIYYLNVTNNGTPGKNTYILCSTFPSARDYVFKKPVTIVTGGTAYPVEAFARGAFLVLVEGSLADQATGAYMVLGSSFTAGHTVTTLAQTPDFGTANYFTVTFPSGGPIQITHPTSGVIANCTIVSYNNI